MKIMLISFFISNNIGDLLISETLKNKLEACGHQVVMYDFLEIIPITHIRKKADYANTVISKSKVSNLVKKMTGRMGQCLKYKYGNKRNERFKQFSEDLALCNEVYFGGGNMLMDITPVWPFILQDYVCEITKHNIPYSFVAVGVGPILYSQSKKIFRKLLAGAQKISVRGKESGELLVGLGIDSYEVTIDPVLTLDLQKSEIRKERIRKYLEQKKIDVGIGLLGTACFRTEKEYQRYIIDIQNVIHNLALDSHVDKIVLFTTEAMDYETVNSISDEGVSEIVCGNSAQTIIDLYDRLDYVISGRMHSLILAQRCLVPFLGICWQKKVKEFCNQVDASESFVELEQLENIALSSLKIEEKISYAWLTEQEKRNDTLRNVRQVWDRG